MIHQFNAGRGSVVQLLSSLGSKSSRNAYGSLCWEDKIRLIKAAINTNENPCKGKDCKWKCQVCILSRIFWYEHLVYENLEVASNNLVKD